MENRLTAIKAIRLKCLDCSAGSANEVRDCPIDSCTLYPYRFGKNPYIKREYTDEQRAEIGRKLKEANSIKKHTLNNV